MNDKPQPGTTVETSIASRGSPDQGLKTKKVLTEADVVKFYQANADTSEQSDSQPAERVRTRIREEGSRRGQQVVQGTTGEADQTNFKPSERVRTRILEERGRRRQALGESTTDEASQVAYPQDPAAGGVSDSGPRFNHAPAASFEMPEPSALDTLIHRMQDKHVDTKRPLELAEFGGLEPTLVHGLDDADVMGCAGESDANLTSRAIPVDLGQPPEAATVDEQAPARIEKSPDVVAHETG